MAVAHLLGAYPIMGEKLSTYTYSTSAWGDLLTNYNGKTITYDEIGNPLEWRNAESFTWSGSKLTDLTSDGGLRGMYFKYNADGIRTFKNHYDHRTADMYDVSYTVDGTKIISEQYTHIVTGDSYTLYYFYDVSGDIISFEYNGDMYYFQKNSRGDVLRIIDSLEEVVANYTYDAWGKLLSVTGKNGVEITDKNHIAHRNPFRYRSYYYDTETGFYYLNSRYYDPEVGRFINADDTSYLGADGTLLSCNLFAYCMNNPVNRFDEEGNWSLPNWAKVAIGAVALAGAIALTVATGGGAAAVAVGVAKIVGSVAVSTAVSAGVGYLQNGKQGAIDGACNGFMSGSLSALGGAALKYIKVRAATTGSPNSMGKAGERLAGIDQSAKRPIEVNGRIRIPDELTDTTLREVKNVKYIYNTPQLKDFAQYAHETGRSLELVVRPTTKVAKTVIDAGWEISYLW